MLLIGAVSSLIMPMVAPDDYSRRIECFPRREPQ
jgi:hypothetical protein